ncbi:MAG: hypothetical protein M4D80_38895 [Myxococcota bacterium]|nr:hypothetical protein [Myxococcota bacterium]
MRTFLPAVLLCAAACGDNMFDPEQEGPPVDEPGWENVQPHFVPEVCDARAWPSVAYPDRDVDLTVVPTPTGAAIFTVDRAGGPLRGFAINGRGELETKEQGNILRDDHVFTAVSAAYIDERIVTAAVTDEGSVAIDMIRPDLGATYNLSTPRGTMIADVPLAHVRDQRLAAIGDANDGVSGIRFNTAWQTSGTVPITAKAPRSMTASRYRDDTMVVWSTESTCHTMRIGAEVSSTRSFPCLNGRIAINANERAGYMLYEEGADKLMISQIRVGGESEIANTRLFLENARAPKIVFDGTHYWISYINLRQDVVVGTLDTKQGTLVSMALEGTQPMTDGYELAIVNGAVWVFSVDGAGANASRLCLKPVR